MAEIFTSSNRPIVLDTPLGPDKLLVRAFTVTEGISQLFSVQLGLVSTEPVIKFDDIIGKNVTLAVLANDGKTQRFFNGIVSRFAQLPSEGRFSVYEAELVPWLWLLTRSADCFITQKKNVPDIVRDVFQRHQQTDFEISSLQRQYRVWEYSVQYRETACRYVMRLLEQEGLYFFFRHERGKHTMVIGDAVGTHKPCPGQSQLKFSPTFDSVQQRGEGVVVAWRAEQEIRPGKYSLNDFNFETPGTKLLVSEPSRINQGGNQALEIYDYPGEYDSRSEGEDYVRARIEEEEVPHAIFSGSSDCRMLESGFHFELAGFDHFERGRTDQNGEYLLVSIIHNGRQVGLTLDRPADNNVPYSNSFTCIPLSVPFRPPRVTPRPLVQGTQTAIVVGPKGEEIFTDKYGRVKVQFHWDREGKHDENTTCFIRVSQPWAGKNWGAINIPRIGQEVIVDFLEGDPDQPIIVGRVYNASQMPPYELPANQTRTTFLTRSSKNGSTSNFNELRFEDKKDDEQIFLNAEKDMDWRVEKESREFVGASRHLQVNASQLESVGGDKHSEVAGKHFEKVKGDTSIHLCAKCMEQVDSDQSLQVGGDRKEQITGNDSLTVGQNRKEKVGQNESITIGQNRDVKVGMNDALSASQAVYITGGMNVVIQAGMQLSLVGPGGFIDIGPAGVSIQGTMVLINSGGAPGSAQSASPDSPDSPDQPDDPKGPDTADDGSKGGKLNQ